MAMSLLAGSAASAEGVTVEANRLYMRKEASASAKSLGIVEKDDVLSFVAEDGEWYQVKNGDEIGFVMKEYVMLNAMEIAADVEANTEMFSDALDARTTARINMRRLPMTDSDVVKVLSKKAQVEIVGQCGVWYLVKYGSKTGYVMAQYLTVEGQTAQSAAVMSIAADEIYSIAHQGRTTTRVNMRTSPASSAKVAEVVDKNDRVTVLGENNGWYLVSASGEVGYISKAYVRLDSEQSAPSVPTQPEQNQDTLYASSLTATADERLNMRKKPSTSADIVKVISRKQTLTVLGENGSWYKVSASGKTGYVSKEYVTLNNSSVGDKEENSSALISYAAALDGVLTERVNLRQSASTSADVVKVLDEEDSVAVLGEQGNFYQVKFGQSVGFVAKKYVALIEKDEDEMDEPTIEETDKTPSVSDTIYSTAKEGMTTVKVNLRSEPEGDVLYTLGSDTTLKLIGERGSWYLVSYMNTVGYISKSYVTQVISAPSAPVQPDNNTVIKPEVTLPDTSVEGKTAYVTGNVNMRRGAGTSYGVIRVLTRGDEITYYGVNDGWYLVKEGDITGYVSAKYVTTTKPEVSVPSNPGNNAVAGKVQMADWWTSGIQKTFSRGTIATVTDVDTGLSWQVKRSGGTNHADVQPLTAADTAKMKQAYGGKWSWNRRAIWVTIDGVRYAASMNGMPHGSGSITTNNFDGHHCIHFLNSRTHTGNRWDTAHQSMVQKAFKAGQ